jgi:hypothetical protein
VGERSAGSAEAGFITVGGVAGIVVVGDRGGVGVEGVGVEGVGDLNWYMPEGLQVPAGGLGGGLGVLTELGELESLDRGRRL